MKKVLLIVALLACEMAFAEESLLDKFSAVLDFIDSVSWAGRDTNYVAPYKEHWRVEVGSMFFKNASEIGGDIGDEESIEGSADGSLRSDFYMQPEVTLGYRILMGSYSFNLNRKEYYFAFNFDSDGVGGDFFFSRTSSLHGDLGTKWNVLEGMVDTPEGVQKKEIHWDSTITIDRKAFKKMNMLADVYYVFNSKRFSYSAGLNQMCRQKKSSGSLIAAATYARTRISTDDEDVKNFWLRLRMVEGVELGLGLGYARNFVYNIGENHHFLFMLSFLPSVVVYDKQRFFFDVETIGYISRSNWIWDHINNDETLVMLNTRLALSYTYKNFFIAATMHAMGHLLSESNVKLEENMISIKAYTGIRF